MNSIISKKRLKELISKNHPADWGKVHCKLLFDYLSNVLDGCYDWSTSSPGTRVAGAMVRGFSSDMEAYAVAPNGFGSEYVIYLTDEHSTGVQKAWADYIRTATQLDTDDKLKECMHKDKEFMNYYEGEPENTLIQRYKDYVMMESGDNYLATCDDNHNAIVHRNWHLGDAW